MSSQAFTYHKMDVLNSSMKTTMKSLRCKCHIVSTETTFWGILSTLGSYAICFYFIEGSTTGYKFLIYKCYLFFLNHSQKNTHLAYSVVFFDFWLFFLGLCLFTSLTWFSAYCFALIVAETQKINQENIELQKATKALRRDMLITESEEGESDIQNDNKTNEKKEDIIQNSILKTDTNADTDINQSNLSTAKSIISETVKPQPSTKSDL